MARPPRVDVPGGVYHVTVRGNDRRTIYRDDRDREAFLLQLDRRVRKARLVVLAHCLMANHYHLVVEAPFAGLSNAMRELNGGYSRRTNQRYGGTGHLFQNRFGAKPAADDAHLLECCRYVVLNPVRAGICADPADWPWSSYRACAGLDPAPPFLAVDALLALFGSRPDEARAAYRAFVRDGHVPVSDTVTEVSRGDEPKPDQLTV